MAKIGYIQVTRHCNQHCIICSNPENKKTLGLVEAKREIDSLKKQGYESVILTGGEPTLYEKLPELIRYAAKKGIFPRIVTNGQKTANMAYLESLKKSGLKHIHLSVYSGRNKVQTELSRNKKSLQNIKKTLDNLAKIEGITVDINTAINKFNADHLSETAAWIVDRYPLVNHFVFNNLDPFMNRVAENPEVVPTINDFELELHKTLELLAAAGKTFRVERVPLCYMADFEHVSTETRKIVKKEGRTVYFLDDRGKLDQKDWFYKKGDCCSLCSLKQICAGLYTRGGFYKESELHPVFIDPAEIVKKIKKDGI